MAACEHNAFQPRSTLSHGAQTRDSKAERQQCKSSATDLVISDADLTGANISEYWVACAKPWFAKVLRELARGISSSLLLMRLWCGEAHSDAARIALELPLSVPIQFDRSKPFDTPRVMLKLSGQEAEFLFDTGTSPTMFFHSFVAAHPTLPMIPQVDGAAVENLPLQGSLAGVKIAVAAEIPDTPFEDFRNMAGLFSPQSITEGVKVIDFIDGNFQVYRTTATQDVLRRLERERGLHLHAAPWHGAGIPPIPPLLLKGSIGRFKPKLLDVDTGSFRSRYSFSPRKSGIAVRNGPKAADIFGHVRQAQETVRPLPVRVNDIMMGATPILAGGGGLVLDLPYHGTIGMDVLRNCILIIPEAREQRLYWFCRMP